MNKPYLKSMDIQGFKSFEKQTHIDFSPKINVILGGHDTGKTNILDAIKLCLFDEGKSSGNWDVFHGESDINFAEVNLTFGTDDNNSDTVLKRRIELKNNNSIKSDERFINGKLIAEGYFSGHLFSDNFLKKEADLNRLFSGILGDRHCGGLEISISSFLPTPLCLIDDSLSPSDEPLNEIITSMIKGLSESAQCIVVSNMRQIAMEADRMIGVTIEGDSSKVIELKRQE